MYQDDSFFSLSLPGSIGLGLLSLALAVGLLTAAWRLMDGRHLAIRVAIVAISFIGFVWLSPQIYYTYYGFLFEDLPAQWVARWPSLERLAQTITFSGRATLSAHSQGLLFWALFIQAIVRRAPRL